MAYSTDSGSDLGLMENTSDEKLIEVYTLILLFLKIF